eukprot:753776-Hanusia_phi.AAC.7
MRASAVETYQRSVTDKWSRYGHADITLHTTVASEASHVTVTTPPLILYLETEESVGGYTPPPNFPQITPANGLPLALLCQFSPSHSQQVLSSSFSSAVLISRSPNLFLNVDFACLFPHSASLGHRSGLCGRVEHESRIRLSSYSTGSHVGTVVLEACEPFFILSQDGHAASILNRCSSDMMGKMLKSLELETDLGVDLCEAAWDCLKCGHMTYRIAQRHMVHDSLLLVFMLDTSGKRSCIRMFMQRLHGTQDYDAISRRLRSICMEIEK